MSSAGRPLRLFVGVYPPESAARAMLGSLEGLGDLRARRVPLEQLHLTVHFLGATDPRELDDVTESLAHACRGVSAFELTPTRLISLPKRGPVRLIACETDAPAQLLELRRRLVGRLCDRPRKSPVDRFLPHFTLCRFGRSVRGDRVVHAVEMDPFRVDSVRLIRSVLLPDGAEHRELGRVVLEG